MDGTSQLLSFDIKNLGFHDSTVHSAIIASHQAVFNNWTHSKGEGPFLMKLSETSLTAPLLDPLCKYGLIQWYDTLVTKLRPLNIALLPFDAIMVQQGPKGLCPPGMGTTIYSIWPLLSFPSLPESSHPMIALVNG